MIGSLFQPLLQSCSDHWQAMLSALLCRVYWLRFTKASNMNAVKVPIGSCIILVGMALIVGIIIGDGNNKTVPKHSAYLGVYEMSGKDYKHMPEAVGEVETNEASEYGDTLMEFPCFHLGKATAKTCRMWFKVIKES